MRVVVGQARVRRADATSLVVRVGDVSSEVAREQLEAAVTVSIADASLARTMTSAIADALRSVGAADSSSPTSSSPPIVRLRTHKRLAHLAPHDLAGAIVIVRVTDGNARRLCELVDGVRAARALAVQIVWNGHDPERSRVERHVFAVLERARSMPSGPPVVLAKTDEPVEALRILVGNLQRDDRS